ncbi:PepSY domain-containing protein [Chloroflexus sp. Y-396-1]|uniref:PepSY domain-containing protein n=1 Tax=Chloroflexus sp. Y-396-1 TaxID=867845 RepID=UPI0004918FB9|nr:PepSY domain-containing protein [Chloroflexus sp. Y-396-1]
MNRTMFLIAATLTAFVLVVIGGVVSRISTTSAPEPVPTEIVVETTPVVVPALDPTAEALLREREAAYQAALAEANRRLAEANQQLNIAQRELNEMAAQESAPAPAVPAPAAPAPAAPAPAAPAPVVPAPVAPAPAVPAPAAPPAPVYAVSPKQAQAIAQANAQGATLIRPPELVSLQGVPAYEVIFDRGAIYVDAQTGAVLANTISTGTQAANAINADQAIAAAVAYMGGGTVAEVKREYEHGVDVYEVKFTDGSEVYVDAYSGQVVYAKVKNNDDGKKKDEKDDDHDKDKKDD